MASALYMQQQPSRPSPLHPPPPHDRPVPPNGSYQPPPPPPPPPPPQSYLSTMLHPQAQVSQTTGPGPTAVSMKHDGKIYSLLVEQQPIRARMCGFGDKDRRPITPPPCVRLVVIDERTHRELDPNEIDVTYGVLTVDLWNQDATEEVNLVRHSASDPSITNVTTTSYPPPPPVPRAPNMFNYLAQPPPPPYSYNYPQMQQSSGYYAPIPQTYGSSQYPAPIHPEHPIPREAIQNPNLAQLMTPPTGMFSRNLIGSLSVSAQKLVDPSNKIGIWFVLQDLSVRTEGFFRLKMSFVNVVNPESPINLIKSGSAPILASVFSDVFQVYSAKKFPGVIESTALSKCFAQQGIKIPIRKDAGGAGKRNRQDDSDGEGSK